MLMGEYKNLKNSSYIQVVFCFLFIFGKNISIVLIFYLCDRKNKNTYTI